MTAVGDLHGRCMGVAIDYNDLHTETLQFNNDLFAQFAAPQRRTRTALLDIGVPIWGMGVPG